MANGNAIVAVKGLLEQRRDSFLRVLPKTGIEPERFFRLAVYASQNPGLEKCNPTSIVRAIYAAAALGLSLDPSLGHAYIVPRKGVANFQPGYKGLIELAIRSGRISEIHAEVVYVGDVFEVEKGTNRRVVHKPLVELGVVDGGELRAAYVTWKDLATGSIEFHVIGRKRIERAKKASQTVGSSYSPWASDEAAMWLKTAIHDARKFWTLSPELNRAVSLDIQAATGQPQHIDEPDEPEADGEEREQVTSLDSLDDDSSDEPPSAPPVDGPTQSTSKVREAEPAAPDGPGEFSEPIEGEQPDGPPPMPVTHDDLVDSVAHECGIDMNEAAKRLKLALPKPSWAAVREKAGWWARFVEGDINTLVPLKTWKKQPA